MAAIRKLPSGRWQAQIRKQGHTPLSKTFRTKVNAEKWARDTEDSIERGEYQKVLTAQATHVGELLRRYDQEILTLKGRNSADLAKLKVLDRHLGNLSVGKLTPQVVLEFTRNRLEVVCSDTVRKDLITLSKVLKRARVMWRLHLPENPVAIAKEVIKETNMLKPGRERLRRLEQRELETLLAACNPEMKDLIEWAVETGMRRGEMLNARREHVKGPTLYIPETKTGKPRTIALSSKARDILARRPIRMDGYIFDRTKPNTLSVAFERVCKKAGIEDLRFHDLRHEATSRLFEKGLGIQEVASITGHSDWKSLKRYTHVSPEEVARKLG